MRAAKVEGTRPVKRMGNLGIPILALLLAAFGVLMVYSASYYTAEHQTGDAFFFL